MTDTEVTSSEGRFGGGAIFDACQDSKRHWTQILATSFEFIHGLHDLLCWRVMSDPETTQVVTTSGLIDGLRNRALIRSRRQSRPAAERAREVSLVGVSKFLRNVIQCAVALDNQTLRRLHFRFFNKA